jgi:hypothetical protein
MTCGLAFACHHANARPPWARKSKPNYRDNRPTGAVDVLFWAAGGGTGR